MATQPASQPTAAKKGHIPAVGIIALIFIAVTVGGLFYTQFLHPPNTTCTIAPLHRVYIMTAIIQDVGGYQVQGIYSTNITGPIPTNSSGLPRSLNSGNFTKLSPRADPKEVYGNPGDIITVYVKAVNSTVPPQYPGIPGHGFDFTDKSFIANLNVTGATGNSASQPTPAVLRFGQWVTLTFQIAAQGSGGFFCTVSCSDQHPNMKGTLRAGCGS